MARPEVNIDWNKVDRMMEAGCDGTEIASTIGIHPNTLYRRCEEHHKMSFSDYLAQKRASGTRLLKMKQFEVAMSGDRTMLVWLGKQRLGQSEKNITDITTKGESINETIDLSKLSDDVLRALLDATGAEPEENTH